MRYGIPVSGGTVCAHFGHCEQFALIDADDVKKEIVKMELVPAPAHQPGLLPEWLAEQGVNVAIAGGMGSRAQSLLQEKDIEVCLGVTESDPEMLVQSHLNGTLMQNDNICDH